MSPRHTMYEYEIEIEALMREASGRFRQGSH